MSLDIMSMIVDIDKIYLYAKDSYETKYQLIINKRESTSLNMQAFIEYSNDMDDIYKNIEENNLIRECKLSIVLDDMIVDMLSNRNCQQRVTENIVRNKKLNISFVFNTQSYSKQEFQQITINHLSDIDFKDYKSLQKIYYKTTLFFKQWCYSCII